MILFLSQNKNYNLESFALNFSKKNGIKTTCFTISDVHKNCDISISFKANRFISSFNDIDFNKIKLCYINSSVSFYKELFEFKSNADKDYAQQEWNASLLCLLETNKNTKFINPFLKRYDCETELEQVLLFRKYQLDTVEMFMTNNSENFLTLYDIYNNNLLIKNILANSNHYKLFEKKDLKKLDKLHLSPYIFQKPENGSEIIILMLSDDVITYDLNTNMIINIPLGIKERLINLRNELNISLVLFRAFYDNDRYYFYSLNQYPEFTDMVALFKQDFQILLESYLIKEYNS